MIKFVYTTEQDELLKEVGIEEKDFWEYMSLDDWDYALIFDGHIPPRKLPEQLLVGCCSNEWVYFPKQNKTVGLAYHS